MSGTKQQNLGEVGKGQAWQDVTGQRSLGVTYTNTTEKSIVLNIRMSTNVAGGMAKCVVDGVELYGGTYPNSLNWFCITALVPAGSTYMAMPISGAGTLHNWKELR